MNQEPRVVFLCIISGYHDCYKVFDGDRYDIVGVATSMETAEAWKETCDLGNDDQSGYEAHFKEFLLDDPKTFELALQALKERKDKEVGK